MYIKSVFYVQALKSEMDTGNQLLKPILQFKDLVSRKTRAEKYSYTSQCLIKRLDQ